MTGVAPHMPALRFLADANVGKLARRLRMLGYDTLFPRNASDDDLVRIAILEDRILLTRDRGIAQRRIAYYGPLRVLLLLDDDTKAQVRQVVAAFGLGVKDAFTLCLECNTPLAPRSKAEVAGRVPPFTQRTQNTFMECPLCGRIYWRGSHWAAMREELARATGGRE